MYIMRVSIREKGKSIPLIIGIKPGSWQPVGPNAMKTRAACSPFPALSPDISQVATLTFVTLLSRVITTLRYKSGSLSLSAPD